MANNSGRFVRSSASSMNDNGPPNAGYPGECRINPQFIMPDKSNLAPSNIVYRLLWQGPQNTVRGNCVSTMPFELDPIQEPETKKDDTDERPRDHAFEVTTDIEAQPKNYNGRASEYLSDLKVTAARNTRLGIWSPTVVAVLKTIPRFDLIARSPQGIAPGTLVYEPYYQLLNFLPDILRLIEEREEQEAEQLRTLVQFLEPYIVAHYNGAKALISKPSPQNLLVGFEDLWYHFSVGTEIYVRDDDGIRAQGGIVANYAYDDENNNFLLSFETLLICKVGMVKQETHTRIGKFAGLVSILELSCYPAKLFDTYDQGTTRAVVLKSCRNFLELLASGHPEKYYSGFAGWLDFTDGGRIKGQYTGPVIFDHAAAVDGVFDDAYKLGQSLGISTTDDIKPTTHFDFPGSPLLGPEWWEDGSFEKQSLLQHLDFIPAEMTERHAFMFEHKSVVYGLKNKKWMVVDIDALSDLTRLENPLKHVIIPEDDITLIKALSFRPLQSQTQNILPWGVDFIAGKGLGKVVLLHGPPGVGKTYTVECIAEAFKMPLLSLTIANISLEEKAVDQDMRSWFSLAERWGAILLLDEADVFLERRQPADLHRNALVAALLRHIEYYTGLLFMTTNRVGQMDDAFTSRIHVVIGYSRIGDTSRKTIWNAFFDKLDAERQGQIFVGDNARKYVLEDPEINALQWNGREIRNALQTVIALAEYQAKSRQKAAMNSLVVIEEAHFRQYMRMSRAYRQYTFNVAKQDEAKRALMRKDRYDYGD